MSTTSTPLSDPLATEPQLLDRVSYDLGVLLDADDFRAEQLYHRGRLARALAYLHGSGTVAGLEVKMSDPVPPGADEQLIVSPGVALDRLGRLIEVPNPVCIRLDRWYRSQPATTLVQALHPRDPAIADDRYSGVVVDVFLRFVLCAHGMTPAFASGPFDALDAVVPSRVRDHYALELVPRLEDRPPLPQPRWPNLQAIADAKIRATTLRTAVYAAWREGTANENWRVLAALPEHGPGQDTTALFLARLQLPATPPEAPDPRPKRTADVAVIVEDHHRPLVYPSDLLAQFVGLAPNPPVEDDNA